MGAESACVKGGFGVWRVQLLAKTLKAVADVGCPAKPAERAMDRPPVAGAGGVWAVDFHAPAENTH